MKYWRLWVSLLWGIAGIIYFLRYCPASLQADWSHDDLMNCYRAIEASYESLYQDVATFWRPTPFYRPLGQIFYKHLFDHFHFAQFPYRLSVTILLLANAYLLGVFCWRVSGNWVSGLIATTVAIYHPYWGHLYYNTGTIYEILAFTFVVLGLWVYREAREKPWVALPVVLCFVLAINAKESGIVLAPLIVLYELIWHRRIPRRVATCLVVASLAFIVGRVYGPSGVSSIGMYRPQYNIETYLLRFQEYFGHLVLWKSAPVWACLALCALPTLTRQKLGFFAALLFPLAILPLAFVPSRGLEAVYIASASLALGFASFALILPKESLRLVFAVVLWFVVLQWFPPSLNQGGWGTEQRDIRAFHEQLRALVPQMPSNVQIRFEKEPFTADTPWASIFATRLAYRDLTIRVAGEHNPHGKEYSRADDFLVFTWEAGKLKRLK
ncbi:MAG: hypothetical protein OHK0021_19180 [Bryobacter sp.]